MVAPPAEKEKNEFEQVQAELQRTADEFAVFERKDIKHKEDLKHLKAKEKKLIETAKKEQEKGDKAREAIPKQEKMIKECEGIVANMEKQIPREQEILDALYESAKGETKSLRCANLQSTLTITSNAPKTTLCYASSMNRGCYFKVQVAARIVDASEPLTSVPGVAGMISRLRTRS